MAWRLPGLGDGAGVRALVACACVMIGSRLPAQSQLPATPSGPRTPPVTSGDSVGRALPAPPVFDGYALRTAIPSLRSDEAVTIDGRLDEAIWQRAPVLTGFSQYVPVDERKADDSTEVFVWYSASAIHFGIRAYAAPGTLRATLADRDRIDGEDHVQILLDTDNAHRRAFVFAVNAYGVQADGIRVEGSSQGNTPRLGLQNSDITPDFVFASKGRLTDFGYEVEVRIPFKSIRYGSGEEQVWGLNVVRQVQATGVQETWYPVKRANASFLVQMGQLTGLHELKRGLTLDLNPVVTSVINGAPSGAANAQQWAYRQTPEVGGNVRWGVTPNLTLNATFNPDFSQVEADVQQIPGDARFPVFFPERRPFFTDGIELFELPNRLVYTRRIVAPTSAARMSGKIGKTDVAVLSALDDRSYSLDPDRTSPLFNILRLRRDVGAQGWVGALVTDRTDGAAFNRVGSLDTRLVLTRLLQWSAQAIGSTTRGGAPGAPTRNGAMLYSSLTRTGRQFGFRYEIRGVTPDFVTQSGFIPRADYVESQIAHRVSYLGREGAWLQNWSPRVRVIYTHLWNDFQRG
ncbi:MAG: carbohydrate binding family 9 domain-containing protein, partial [Gemmatimonadaceae bacterium]|nr:carbohydrate binding family 9 domain-containing protein [Gemmatimonadaceae bacterium]